MDLPNLLNRLKQREEIIRRLMAVEITPFNVKSAVWQVRGIRTEVVSVGSIQAWDTDDISDLVTALDTSLTEALAGLENEPNEVVFGLPEIWVGTEGIAESKKPILKEVCQKLKLKAVGFVVTTEAMVQYLRDLEGGPPSAILVHMGADNVAISLVYLGNLQGTQVVGKSGDLASDVEEGLARFANADNLPSRMILFDGREDLEAAKQALISHDWQANLPFLHFPKIESLPKEFSIKAVAIAGGAEVAKSLGYADINSETSEGEEKAEEETEISEVTEVDRVFKPKKIEAVNESESIQDLSETFGFTEVFNPKAQEPITLVPASLPEMMEAVEEKHEKKKPRIKIQEIIRKLWGQVKLIKPPRFRPKSTRKRVMPRILYGLLFSLLGIIGFGYWYWNYPKAEITLYVYAKPLEKQMSFIVNPQAKSLDTASATLPGTQEMITVSGSLTNPTTGVKTVGERAKGEITIYNRTNQPKIFAQGTAIKYQNLRLTLDEEVTVASASVKFNSDFSVTTEPSRITTKVTAVDIGDQYNLGANTQFTIANFAEESYIAVNGGPLTGGSARQVAAVSEEDITATKEKLINQLQEQIRDEVRQKTVGREAITTDKQIFKSEDWNAEVGEEADSIQLTMSMEQAVYTYTMNDVTLIAQQAAFSDIPTGYVIQPTGTKVAVQKTVVNDDETVSIVAKITLTLMPKLDTVEIARNIRGKYPELTENYLKNQAGFAKSTIVFRPELPKFLTTIPKKLENISIRVATIE